MVRTSHESDKAHRRAVTEELVGQISEATGHQRRLLENDLIAVNLGVAREVAARYHGRGIPADDLDQVASLGLVKAVRNYDPAKATDFLSFAVPTIRGEIRRHFRDAGWTVRPPRSVQEMQAQITRAQGELWQELGREPKAQEIADHLEVELDPVLNAMKANGCFMPSSLDATQDDDDTPTMDRLGETDLGFSRAEARVMLRPLLESLTERERRILELRFFHGKTQAEIGAEIGVTQMQVSRLLTGLFDKLRKQLSTSAA